MSSMWCIDNALCPGWLYLLVTLTDCPELIWDGIMARRQEVSPIRTQHRHPIALASPPLILYSETRHQPVQPSHQQPPAATQYIVGCC